ncbi:MAG: hypothetical protein M3Y28_11965, partial [Armatimonadota bacterium]|nr:hypothetical protein [Armatimonadota bacterium]
ADAERRVADAQAARDTARQAVGAAQARMQEAQSALIALRTRLRTLQDLEDAQEGYFAGVKAVFEARRHGALSGDFTVVADAFQALPGYEVAFETALAASLQDIITGTEDEAKAAIAYLHENRAGRATFLPLNRMRPGRETLDLGRAEGMRGVRGAALDIVTFDRKFEPALAVLLGRVFVCETLDDALRASTAARGWNRVVTLTGELVLPTGALTGGRQAGRTANLLGRKTEIAALQKDFAARERDLKNCQNELTEAETERDRADAALTEAQTHRQAAQLAVSEAGRRAEYSGRDAQRLTKEKTAAVQRAEAAQAALGEAKARAAQAASILATGGVATADADEALAIEAEQIRTLSTERDVLTAELTSARISLATVAEKAGSLDRSLRAARAEADGVGDAQLRKQQQGQAARDEYDALIAQEAERGAETQQARDAQAAAQLALTRQIEARQVLLQESYEASAGLRVLNEARAQALEAIHKNELREARLGAQRDGLAARLRDEYEMSADEALALDDDPETGDGTPQEVARLRRELRAMGEVNTGALDEWEQTRTRHEFLTTQRADLDEARTKLLDAIKDIDASTTGVFIDTFHAVGEAFGQIFTRLFGGGKTDLILTDPDDVLETGIDIMVQPPGKKRQNLALLSGGERALTAVALLFAFLQVKPSPFCVLDEVDAPLDGANVER